MLASSRTRVATLLSQAAHQSQPRPLNSNTKASNPRRPSPARHEVGPGSIILKASQVKPTHSLRKTGSENQEHRKHPAWAWFFSPFPKFCQEPPTLNYTMDLLLVLLYVCKFLANYLTAFKGSNKKQFYKAKKLFPCVFDHDFGEGVGEKGVLEAMKVTRTKCGWNAEIYSPLSLVDSPQTRRKEPPCPRL